MPSLLPQPKWQFLDTTTGRPLSGGKLYTYVSGTTTPLVTYTSQDGGAENTNPITLDSRGECSVFFGDGLAYKLILNDSHGNLIFTADHITINQFCFVQDADPGGGPGTIWVDTSVENDTSIGPFTVEVNNTLTDGGLIIKSPYADITLESEAADPDFINNLAPITYEGGETKFGKWRQYFNAAERTWALTYNTALTFDCWPPVWSVRDSVNASGAICLNTGFNCSEGNTGQNNYCINFEQVNTDPTVQPFSTEGSPAQAGVNFFYWDNGLLELTSKLGDGDGAPQWQGGAWHYRQAAIRMTVREPGHLGSCMVRPGTDGGIKLQNCQPDDIYDTDDTVVDVLYSNPTTGDITIPGNLIVGGTVSSSTESTDSYVKIVTEDLTEGALGTYQIPDTCNCLVIDAAIISGTINMPLTPVVGQICEICFTATGTGIVHTSTSQNIIGPLPATVRGGLGGSWRYIGTASAIWARVDGIVRKKESHTDSVADGGTITHGFGTTPSWVTCTGSVSGESIAVTAKGSTTFTVAIKKCTDGSAGTTQTIYWQCGD